MPRERGAHRSDQDDIESAPRTTKRRPTRKRLGMETVLLLIVAGAAIGTLLPLHGGAPHAVSNFASSKLEGWLHRSEAAGASVGIGASDSLGKLSDAQLRELVGLQNRTIGRLTDVVHALGGSPAAPAAAAAAALGPAASQGSQAAAQAFRQNLPRGMDPALAKSWCQAVVRQGSLPPKSIGTFKRFGCGEIVGQVVATAEEEEEEAGRPSPGTSAGRIKVAGKGTSGSTSGSGTSKGAANEATGSAGGGMWHPRMKKGGGERTGPQPPLIMHGVNLVPPRNGLHADQDVTLASMVKAVRVAERTGAANVTVLAVERQGDEDYPLPDHERFVRSKSLRRTVLDSPHAQLYLNATTPRRPLPLLADILGALFDASDAATEFLVFTNADIGLQPDFYAAAVRLASRRGAVAINRVEIPDCEDAQSGDKFGVQDMDRIYELGQSAPQKHHGSVHTREAGAPHADCAAFLSSPTF